MKFLLTRTPRLRAAIAMALMLAFLPLTSIWNVSEAKPPRHAPAYGYRRKVTTKRYTKRYRRPVYRRTTERRYRENRRDRWDRRDRSDRWDRRDRSDRWDRR